jgi:predicted PurR-regulated permease PerM
MPDPLRPPDPPFAEPPRVAPAGAPGLSGLIGILVAAVMVAALYFGRAVLLPITLAMLLSFVLSPLVELLRRLRLGRILSVIVAVLLALGLILAVGSAIGTQVAQLAGDLPLYQTTIEHKIARLREATIGRFSETIASLGHQFAGPPARSAAPAPAPSGAPAQESPQKPVPVVVTRPAPTALEIGEKVLAPILNPLATMGIILVVTIFALLQKEDLRDRAIRLLGSGDLHRTTIAMNEAGRRLSRYFLTQLGLNTGFGVIVGVGLHFIGVPNPVLWGVLGMLLRFIPYIGSWIAAALPVALAAAVEPGWSMAIWTAALYAATELTIGQFVEPLVYGHSTGLSPLAVIIAAIFWTWIWGPIGLIISTPLTLCLVVLGRHVEQLEFFDVLLGDRPALTPVEGFYQRMLADDPDEALEQAERYLRDHSLAAYYDDVVLQGLRLAAGDILRGTLGPARIERLKGAVAELIRDLDKYARAPPDAGEHKALAASALPAAPPAAADALDRGALAPEWRGEAPVLCIAGRGPLDEAAAGMLAQLLDKRGLGARAVPHEAVSRAKIEALDLRGVAMMCVCYLDMSGNPAHLRFLLRRLRERLPQAPLLVGLWPAQDPFLKDREMRRAAGADYYVSTLHEAVEACLAAACKAAAPPPRLVVSAQDAGAA